MAAEKKCTPTPPALAWVLAQGDDNVAIPDKRRTCLEENLAAERIEHTGSDLRRINELLRTGLANGARYPVATMHLING